MLGDFLPKRYGVTKAFVVDVDGGLSDQLDVVIHDRQYSPLLFEVGGAHFIPAESVYAVFEVKQHLDKGYLEYAGAKAASVRRLRRTSVGFPTANGPAAPRTPPRIIAGILALDSGWSPMFGEPLFKVLGARSVDEQIDLALALRAVAFEVPDPASAANVTACDDPGVALIFFVLRLLKRLQDMATVGAMDLDDYTSRVWPLEPS